MNVHREPDDGERCPHCDGIIRGFKVAYAAPDGSWRTGYCHPKCAADLAAAMSDNHVMMETRVGGGAMTRIEKLLLCAKLGWLAARVALLVGAEVALTRAWMQEGEAWMVPEEWPVCGHCADDFAYPIEEADEKALQAWAAKEER